MNNTTSSLLLVETPWETRNLGRPAFVLTPAFLENPDEDALNAELEALRARGPHFILARVPTRNLVAAPILGKFGFYPVECALTPFTRFADNEFYQQFEATPTAYIPRRYDPAAFRYAPLDRGPDSPLAAVRKLAAGSFSRDRFHVDPFCPPGVANQRFAHWINDEISNPSVSIDALWYRDQLIAFATHGEDHIHLFGFDRVYAGAGLGKLLVFSACRRVKELGHPGLDSLISANNLPVLNLLSRTGFKFKNPQYSFHYWGDGRA